MRGSLYNVATCCGTLSDESYRTAKEREIQGRADPRGGNSARIIPATIKPAPIHCINDRRSPSHSHDVIVANTGSKHSSNAARAVDM